MPYLKHVFKYQEYRRTQFLNTVSKDDLGRHRGGVLYGMKLIPKGNAVYVDAGALYTPFGTKIFWDARATEIPERPLIGSINFNDVLIEGTSVLSNLADRPIVVAVVAELPADMQNASGNQPPIESADDLSGAVLPVTFKAFASIYRQDTARPGFNLLARHPVEMGESDPTGTWSRSDAGMSDQALRTADSSVDPATALNIRRPEGTSGVEAALKVNQILIGYVIIGGTTASTPLSLGVDVWAEGVTYVPVMNPWQTLQSLLGVDPLMGRTDGLIDGGVADAVSDVPGAENSALSQKAVGHKMATGATYDLSPLGVPRFGTANAGVAGYDPTGSTYRFPNFARDGDSIIETMRRMDYLLRLWMNKTGDQGLVRSAQDGVVSGPTTYLKRFSPLDSLIYQMDGQEGPTAHNLNTANWGADNDLPLNIGSDTYPGQQPNVWAAASVAAVDDDTLYSHALKSGVMTHKPSLLDITTMGGAGDSHRQAIRALDWSMFHMLEDVLGVSFRRSWLRLEGPWTSQTMNDWVDLPAGLPVDNTGRTGVQSGFPLRPSIIVSGAGLPGMVASDFNVYLGTEKIKEAVEAVAKRTSQNASPNLLKNAIFAKTGTFTSPGSPLNWVVDAGTTWQIIPNTGGDGTARRFNATLAGTTGRLHQTINLTSNPELLGAILDSGVLSVSVSMAQMSAGVVYVGLKLSDAVSADLLAVGGYVQQTGASVSDGYTNFTFALKFPTMRDVTGAATAERDTLMDVVKYLSIEVLNLDGATKDVDISGAYLGAGMPPLLPMASQDYYEFLSRDGGVESEMRQTLYLGTEGLRLKPRGLIGAPTTGAWDAGALILDAEGVYWRCISSGTPGTWEALTGVPLGTIMDFGGALPAGFIPTDGTVYTAVGLTLSDGSSAAYPPGLSWARLARLRDYLIASGAWGNVDPSRLIAPQHAGRVMVAAGTGRGLVSYVSITSGGSGYGVAPLVTFAPPGTPGGWAATGTAVIEGGKVTQIVVTNSGFGYTVPPVISFSSGTASALASITLSSRTLSAALGEEEHQLIIRELAAHNHGTQYVSDGFRERDGGKGIHYTAGGALVGGNIAHNTMQPFAVTTRGIKY